MNELVREIEEDIRQERIDKLWNSFGKVMVGISVAVILATIGIVIVQNHKRSQAIDVTAQIMKGIDRINIEDFKGAIPIFDQLSQDESTSYYGVVMLRKAQAQAALGQKDEARKTYLQLAKHDDALGSLAKLLSVDHSTTKDEALPLPEKTSAFYFSQSELRAWQLYQQGKKDQAIDQFLALANDPQTPGSMRERVSEVLQHIAPEKLMESSKSQANHDAKNEGIAHE